MEAKLYNLEGKAVGTVALSDAVFGVEVKPIVLQQAIVAYQEQQRDPIAHAKDRSEVRGGGKKPWRQKGTGRARHASIRSPLWVGGGVTFGPTRNRVFGGKMNRKMRRRALTMALSARVSDQQYAVIDGLAFSEIKTKPVTAALSAIVKAVSKDGAASMLVVSAKHDATLERSLRNVPGVQVISADSLNALAVLSSQMIIMTKGAVDVLTKTFTA